MDQDVAAQPLIERIAIGRPTSFPSVGRWLRAGIFRNWRGAVTVLVAAWFYLPAAVFFAVVYAISLGVLALFAGALDTVSSSDTQPWDPSGVPVVGDGLANLLSRSGGVVVAMLAVLLGALVGFIFGLVWVFLGPFDDGLAQGISAVVGAVIGGVIVGLLYTLYRVMCEGWILRITGARRMSRREERLLMPIVAECATKLGLANHPRLLIDDTHDANALAYTRHIVINRGLLEEFNYDRDTIAAVVSHELVHWGNGDPISAVFVRGVGLPLYVVQAGAGWLLQRATGSFLRFAVWSVFWPVFITVKYLVMPMQAADSREAEFRADQGAVLTGHRAGMRHVLVQFRRSFESGRNGWVAAVCAAHPPYELRLERLEEQGKDYPLPDPDAPPVPLPVAFVPET